MIKRNQKINLVIWLYGYTFVLMDANKRNARSYKIVDFDYEKAMQRGAKKGQRRVANIVEDAVRLYGKGYEIFARSSQTGIEIKINR